MFRRNQNAASAPQAAQGSGEYVVSVTDADGHTTDYIGATRAQRDRIVNSCRGTTLTATSRER